MIKEIIQLKRKKAIQLYTQGWSIRAISKTLISGRANVSKWVKMTDAEVLSDNRGWKKGVLRKHKQIEKDRILEIRRQLEKENSYFIGELVVKKNYENIYCEPIESWFVKKVLKEAGCVKKRTIKKKGKSKYMKYPEYTLGKLGKILMSIDFIGPKYLKGGKTRINFLSCKYIRPMKLGIMKKIEGQTTDEVIKNLMELWKTHPIPSVLKVDNDSAFGANPLHKSSLGRLTLFLLNFGISPLYVAPRNPWNNGEVEGFNSVFSKKVWKKLRFEDENELDVEINNFNVEYEKYSCLLENNPEIKNARYLIDNCNIDVNNKRVSKFQQTKVYFLRIVRRKGDKGDKNEKGFIEILGNTIFLGKDLINQFTFSILEIKKEEISINIETDDKELLEVKKKTIKLKTIIK